MWYVICWESINPIFLSDRDVYSLYDVILNVEADKFPSTQSLFALQCSGSLFADCPKRKRQLQAEELWNHMMKSNAAIDIGHYNTFIKVSLDNEKDFRPTDILAEIASKNLTPNRVTYQHLIQKYCQVYIPEHFMFRSI